VPASEVGASHGGGRFRGASEQLFEDGVYGQPGAGRSSELLPPGRPKAKGAPSGAASHVVAKRGGTLYERPKTADGMGSPGTAGAAAT